jgi:hypothetical protein
MSRRTILGLSLWMIAALCQTIAVEAATGISGVTHGAADLKAVPNTPTGQSWYYGIGMPLQLDATTAGVLTNIRRNLTPYGDFEVGNDMVMFNSLGGVNTSRLVPISRPTYENNPDTGVPSITAKYPMLGGFVPWGAKFASNGSSHPYGGSGFGMSQVAFYPADFQLPLPPENQLGYRLEVQQLAYDGSQFTAGTAQRVTQWPVGGTGWEIISPGLSAAIPDGNDLLMPVTCAGFSADSVAGVARFQHGPNGWQPTSFAPITERAATWFEPSLVRDTDGSLLFTARDNHVNGTGNIPLWQSSNGGQAWNQLFFLEDARTGTTLTLNQALDGTPYFMTNTEIGTDRNILEIVPLDAARDGLLSPILARNASADFGPAPSGHGWKVDHGIGAVARLADGQWHGIATYRVLDQGENSGHSATPYTGLYVEEAFSVGDPRPMGFIFAPEPSTLVLTLLAAAGILGYLCARRRA